MFKNKKPLKTTPTPMALASALLVAECLCGSALAAEPELPVVEIVGNTILGGSGVRLADAPSNVQVIKSSVIVDQGSANLADLLNNNLGSVTVSNGTGNAYQNDVAYRGFQATSLLGAPTGLSVYFDGVRMNEPFGANVNWDLIPMNALSEIEVMPGSNPMFGLNTLGGALVLNTKNGKDNPGTAIGILGGSFHRRALNFETGWADLDRNSDFFIAGNEDVQDGFRQYSFTKVQQLYGKARWHDDNTKAEVSVALADNILYGTGALPPDMLSTPSQAYTWPDNTVNNLFLLNGKFDHELQDGDLLSGNLYYRRANQSAANSNVQDDDGCANQVGHCALYGPSGTPGTNSVNTWISAGTAAGRTSTQYPGYSYTDNANTTMVYARTHQDTVGANLMWTNADDKLWDRNNTLSLGLSLDASRVSYNQNTDLAQLINYQTVVQPDNLKYCAPGATQCAQFSALQDAVNVSSNSQNFSIFLTDQLEVTERLKLTASGSFNASWLNMSGANNQYLNDDGGYTWKDDSTGTRYINPAYLMASGNQYVTRFSGVGQPGYASYTYQPGANTYTKGTTVYAAGPDSQSLNGDHHFQRFNPALGFSYLAAKNTNVFGGVSQSMRAPTAIEMTCANPDSPCALPTGFQGDPDLKAVVATTYELGARSRSDDGLAWNVALYDTRIQNDIQFVSTNASQGYFANVGTTERRGLDFGISKKTGPLFLSANYGFVDAIYRSTWTNTQGETVVSGNVIPGIPRESLKLRGAYEFSPEVMAGVNLLAVSGQYAHGDEGNQMARVPGYATVNLDLHYQINDQLLLTGIVSNLFNKRYVTYGVVSQNVYTNGNTDQMFLTPAPPVAAWVGLTYTFGGKKLKAVDKD